MDPKVLVSGVVGIGLLGVAGIFILGGGSEEPGMELASNAGSGQIGLDAGKSAYDLAEVQESQSEEIGIQPRNLQAARGDRGRERGGDRFGRMEDRMMEFDLDGDGILNGAERDAMAQAMRKRMSERFDLDGDGVVSIEEQFAARRDFMLNSRRGQRMRDEFDADGDGVLSEEELGAMNADLDAREAERMEGILRDYDADGDGEMSPEESQAMLDEQFTARRSQMESFAIQFDTDGDGGLNADERVDARSTMIEQRELDSFLRRYDTNSDGHIGPSDSERFTASYGKKEPHGDVNRDGIFNMDDVVEFRDMTERVNSAED